jgi:hypothetical protein
LRVNINSAEDHIKACRWITIAIILHNLIIDVEGKASGQHFQLAHPASQEEVDTGINNEEENDDDDFEEGEVKRCQLTAELLVFRETQGIQF